MSRVKTMLSTQRPSDSSTFTHDFTESDQCTELLVTPPPQIAPEDTSQYFVPKPPPVSERDVAFYGAWWIFNAQSVGGIPKSIALYYDAPGLNVPTENIDDELAYGVMISNISGVIFGLFGHYIVKKLGWYRKSYALNPFYRTFDVFFSLGNTIGEFLSFFPIPFIPHGAQRIVSYFLGGIIGFVLGVCIGIPYMLYREYRLKTLPHERNFYSKTGIEGWSKYTKTTAIIGSNLGKIGSLTVKNDISSVTCGGAVGGISGFFISLIGVPLINYKTSRSLVNHYAIELMSLEKYLKNKEQIKPYTYVLIYFGAWKLYYVEQNGSHTLISIEDVKGLKESLPPEPFYREEDDTLLFPEKCHMSVVYAINGYHYLKGYDQFRHNYIRTGFIIGALIGTVIGYGLSLFIPGLSYLVGMAVFGAFTSLCGGAYYGINGARLTEKYHKGRETDNTWDYATRSTSTLMTAIGMFIGIFVPIPGASIVLGAAFGAIGWYMGFTVIEKAREVEPKEEKVTSCWTIRTDVYSIVCASIGGLIGFCVGGPAGLVLGTAIGGILGWVIGGLADPKGRSVIKKGFKKIFGMKIEEENAESPQSKLRPASPTSKSRLQPASPTSNSKPSTVTSPTSIVKSLSGSPLPSPTPSTPSSQKEVEKKDEFFLARNNTKIQRTIAPVDVVPEKQFNSPLIEAGV